LAAEVEQMRTEIAALREAAGVDDGNCARWPT
jgi:hypothetical protein